MTSRSLRKYDRDHPDPIAKKGRGDLEVDPHGASTTMTSMSHDSRDGKNIGGERDKSIRAKTARKFKRLGRWRP